MNLADLPLMLTVDEFARDVLRADRKTGYELVKTGQIRSVRLGRAIRIPRAAVADFLGEPDPQVSVDDGPDLRVIKGGGHG